MGLLNNVAIQWMVRRIPEYTGIIASVVGTITLAPPEVRETIMAILAGQGGAQTALAYFGLVSWIYSQVISYRATVKPQAVVEENGKLVSNPLTPRKETEVAEAVRNVDSSKTLWDIIRGK